MSFTLPRRVLGLTAMAVLVAAGCATDPHTGSEPAEVAQPATGNRPGSYAVIDGEKAPIPDIRMGDAATVARIVDEGAKRNRVMDHLTHLSNTIGPRLTGSSGAEAANKWTRDQFKAWGLVIPPFESFDGRTSSDPDLRGLFQWGQIATRFDRGPSTGRIVAIRNPTSETPEYRTVRELEFASPAWASGTSGPVRGPVVKMPETDAQFDDIKDKVKGSWILIRPTQPGRRGIVGSSSARLQLYADIRKRWKTGEAAAEPAAVDRDVLRYEGTMTSAQTPEGAPFSMDVKLTDPKAVIGTVMAGGFRTSEMVGGTFDPATRVLKFRTEGRANREYTLNLDGDTLKGQTTLPDNGGTIAYSARKVAIEEPRKGPTMEERLLALEPAGWISGSSNELVITGGAPGWDKLEPDTVTPDVVVSVRQSDYDYMNSRLSDGAAVQVEFDLKNTFTKGPIPVYNTIAEIRGTTWPDQVVVVSGHLDSWNGPSSQGTTDNGTGSAVTMEAARILTAVKARPKRTIRFILWTGEEQGLLGSASYVKHLKEKGTLEKVSVCLVDDGGTNYEGGLGCVEAQVPYLAAATAPVNGRFYSETDKKFLDVNIHRQKVFTQVGGSDHTSFNREKVPGFFWDEVGRANYTHTHHTQYDRLDQAIPEYLQQSSTCAAVTAYNLACAPEFLPRPSESEWPQTGRAGGRRSGPAQPTAPGAPGTPRPGGQ